MYVVIRLAKLANAAGKADELHAVFLFSGLKSSSMSKSAGTPGVSAACPEDARDAANAVPYIERDARFSRMSRTQEKIVAPLRGRSRPGYDHATAGMGLAVTIFVATLQHRSGSSRRRRALVGNAWMNFNSRRRAPLTAAAPDRQRRICLGSPRLLSEVASIKSYWVPYRAVADVLATL